MNPIPEPCGTSGAGPVTSSEAARSALESGPALSRSVIVVEDDNGLREQLVKIRNSVAGIRCVGVCRSAEELSPREGEVLKLLASGFIYQEIGDQLGIGSETVRTYVKNICEKMHVRGRLEAVARHRVGSGGA